MIIQHQPIVVVVGLMLDSVQLVPDTTPAKTAFNSLNATSHIIIGCWLSFSFFTLYIYF